jgi:hypothetical protein
MTFVEWSDEKVAELRRLWADRNLSAADIAEKLGPEFSRNAIIGKAHRIHLPGRDARMKPVKKLALIPHGMPASTFYRKRRAERRSQEVVRAVLSPPTTITIRPSRKAVPEMTKAEMRRMFASAWANTAALLPSDQTD